MIMPNVVCLLLKDESNCWFNNSINVIKYGITIESGLKTVSTSTIFENWANCNLKFQINTKTNDIMHPNYIASDSKYTTT